VTKRLGSSVAVVHQRRKQSGQESALMDWNYCDSASRHKGPRDTSCRYVEPRSATRIPWSPMPSAPQAFYSRETLTPLTCPTEDISSILSSLLNSSWFVFLSSSRLSTKTDVGSARRWLAEESFEVGSYGWKRGLGAKFARGGGVRDRQTVSLQSSKDRERCGRGCDMIRIGRMTYSRVRRRAIRRVCKRDAFAQRGRDEPMRVDSKERASSRCELKY
jgi:hypothetical protein